MLHGYHSSAPTLGNPPVAPSPHPPDAAKRLLDQVIVTVQFPKVVRTADLHVSSGTCLFDEALKVKKRNRPDRSTLGPYMWL